VRPARPRLELRGGRLEFHPHAGSHLQLDRISTPVEARQASDEELLPGLRRQGPTSGKAENIVLRTLEYRFCVPSIFLSAPPPAKARRWPRRRRAELGIRPFLSTGRCWLGDIARLAGGSGRERWSVAGHKRSSIDFFFFFEAEDSLPAPGEPIGP